MDPSPSNPADAAPLVRLRFLRVVAVAAVCGILSEVVLAPFFYLDYRVGFGGAAMLLQFAIGMSVMLLGSAGIIAVHRRWYAALPALLPFSLLYGVVSQVARLVLVEPTAETGSFATSLWVALRVGVVDAVTLLVVAIIPAVFIAKAVRSTHGMRSLLDPGACWRCCYRLEGLPSPARCPECGTAGQPSSLSRPVAMFLLGEGGPFRLARWCVVGLVAAVSAAAVTRLALAEGRQDQSQQLAQGIPAVFAEPPGRVGMPPRLGKAVDVSAQFGLSDPYRLHLVMSLAGESPPRAQLLLMYATPMLLGGTGMEGIAFGELTSAERDQVLAGAAPPTMLTPVARYITRHQGSLAAGKRYPPIVELWVPPTSPSE